MFNKNMQLNLQCFNPVLNSNLILDTRMQWSFSNYFQDSSCHTILEQSYALFNVRVVEVFDHETYSLWYGEKCALPRR